MIIKSHLFGILRARSTRKGDNAARVFLQKRDKEQRV